jgi:hypothetical protein
MFMQRRGADSLGRSNVGRVLDCSQHPPCRVINDGRRSIRGRCAEAVTSTSSSGGAPPPPSLSALSAFPGLIFGSGFILQSRLALYR